MTAAKERHGCLTAWLVLMIVGNSMTALTYTFASGTIQKSLPNAPSWAFAVLIVASLVNLACSIALLQWKKWGFFGFIGTTAVALIINLIIGVSPVQAMLGLLGVGILYGVLQIGGEKKGWTQLE
jgi:hypothetical protein